jgi:5-methylcytosine-specific restriction endonuclease McrA
MTGPSFPGVCTYCGKTFIGRGIKYCSLVCSGADHVGEKHFAWIGGNSTRKDRAIKYREINKVKIAERKREEYLKNKDKIISRARAYYRDNIEKIKEHNRLKNAANPEPNRKRVKEWALVNKDKVRILRSRWKKNNKDKVNVGTQNRRSKKKSVGGELSKNIVDKLKTLQKNKCAICKSDLNKTGYHLDHIIPTAKGGKNEDRNTQLTCPTCNTRKKDQDPIQFMQKMGYLL